MAKDYTFGAYKKSGFAKAANIASLQEQLSNYYNRSDEQMRSDAQAQYQTEYEGNKLSLQNQLNQLNTQKNADMKSIRKQYDKTGSDVQRQLYTRGMGRSSLVSTLGTQNENAYNSALSAKSLEYLTQENDINANIQKLGAEYAQNVENKYAEIRDKQVSDRINLMSQIASIQSGAYDAYVNYMLQK